MIYVMSDIHGDRDKFEKIMKKIELKPDDKLYVLGDIIDRGKDGIGILLDLMKMDNAIVLLGNHEWMFLNAIKPTANMNDIKLWYRNYGNVTHDAYLELPIETQNKLQEFILHMPITAEVTINGKNYLLVHGAPPELQYKLYSTFIPEREFATWERIKPNDIMPKGKTVIFGHTPTDDYQSDRPLRIWHGADKIGIDCGCGHSHPACRLACLRLDDMKEYYSDKSNQEIV